MKKKICFYAAISTCFILIIIYCNIKPTINKEDVTIEATLGLNTTGKSEYQKYCLDIKVIKSKKGILNIYPYFNGLKNLTFDSTDGNKFFVPENLGAGGENYIIAKKILRDNNFLINNDLPIVSYILPNEAGEYISRFYINSEKDLSEIENPLILCIYTERRFGKKLSWVKKIPITISSASK
ncbi:hypothetical protein QA584_27005 [Anaerocolumna sp. AGMB13025]|uniref:hypothetical protein n=1 Tax=Anaerocolumna sp. AGMB13025 TaxID=3039116 RepID=UPI00241F3E38|nr:hypothetical protein [Anaerocolumna sp. AGMB13025]WFR57213.1 hypothetical protein QA584_27005 [Anaerocolumna sp. AGMB13025]